MIERIPTPEPSLEILVSRLEDPKRIGSLTEKQFRLAIREKTKYSKAKEEVFNKFYVRWNMARKAPQAQEEKPKEQEIKHEEPHPNTLSWEEFAVAFKDLIPSDQWDQIAAKFGEPTKQGDTTFEPMQDASELSEGDHVKLQLTDQGPSLNGTFIKQLEEDNEGIQSYQVQLERNAEIINVTAGMILVPRKDVAHEPEPALVADEAEVLEVITPSTPATETPEPQTTERVLPFSFGDHVSALVKFSDGSERLIQGTVLIAGVEYEDKEKNGKLKAAVYSPALPDADQRIIVIDQSDLQPSHGEVIARKIERDTGFSPKDIVLVERDAYRVVGIDSSTGVQLLELVPNFLFGYSTVNTWLNRIFELQHGEEPTKPGELEEIQENIKKLFAHYTITKSPEAVRKLRG